LIDAINDFGGEGTVTAVAYWDNTFKQIQGAAYETGTVTVKEQTEQFDPALTLIAAKGYQISVNKKVNLLIRR
jgi:hypothetical protein